MKVNIHLNLLENINFYQCELTTQNMKISKTLGVSFSSSYTICKNIEI